MVIRNEFVVVRQTATAVLVTGVICVAIEPLVTATLSRLGLLVSGVQFGWWVNVSILLGNVLSFIGQCLLAIGVCALFLAHFLTKATAAYTDGDQPRPDAILNAVSIEPHSAPNK